LSHGQYHRLGISSLEQDIIEGENPVCIPGYCSNTCQPFDESGCLGLQPKMGGRSHPKLNIFGRPIAKKYSDGKVKRTLKRRLKVLENVKSETDNCQLFARTTIPIVF